MKKKHGYLFPMMASVVKCKQAAEIEAVEQATAPNVATVPPAAKEDMVAQHSSRFLIFTVPLLKPSSKMKLEINFQKIQTHHSVYYMLLKSNN